MSKVIAGVTLYDLKEVSKAFELSVRTLRKYIKSKKITAKKLGNYYYLTDIEIKNFLTNPAK